MLQLVLMMWFATSGAAPIGDWTGTSICTGVRPTCHDEQALYRIKPTKDPKTVEISLEKIVDGKPEFMSVWPFHVDYAHRVLTGEFTGRSNGVHGVITLTWTGSHMKGTMKTLPDHQVIRNIDLRKQ